MICDRCDGLISPGDVYYLVEIALTAEMDPTPLGELSSDELEDGLAEALAAASALDEDTLMDGVYERRAFLICDACRGAWRADPIGRGTRPSGGLLN